jgi:hypothetical protein
VEGEEGGGDAVRVEDGERAGLGELGGEGGDGFRREGMHERLVEDVAAAKGVEGLDVQHEARGRGGWAR